MKSPVPIALLILAGAAIATAQQPGSAVPDTRELEKLEAQLAAQFEQLRNLQIAIERQRERIDRALGGRADRLEDPGAVAPAPLKPKPAEESSPLSFRIGMSNLTPVGFMDFTTVTRSTAPGTGIGTNFGSIPFGNTAQGRLTETRFSAQNSRIGLRLDSKFGETKVLGYLESDFLGFTPANAAVNSNSDSLRLRLYFADLRRGKLEILGGQSWSMLTPGRSGISPLPADLFYSQNIDVNYQAGLVWSRDPQFRVVYHPRERIAMGLSLEAAEQYVGGSGGGGMVVLPSALVSPYSNQLNNGTTTLTAPSVRPDIVAKIAFDPGIFGRHAHFELAGVARSFRTYNTLAQQPFRQRGGGAAVNLLADITRNFRLVSANYWSDGGGRWIFGQAPDVVIRGDGSISPLHSGSTIQGVEMQTGKLQVAAYYGAIYIGRNVAIDPSTNKPVGYGYAGSAGGQNRTIQELTFDLNQTIWKDARYGALNLMFQYSYLIRHPWHTGPDWPQQASAEMGFFNLRYTLPGSSPTMR